MELDLLQIVSQFGAAGLIGLLWLAERRLGARRERQLTEAHRRIVTQTHALNAMINVVRDNTSAIVALEHTQRQLIDLAAQLTRRPSHQ